jgi:xanthine dehydrogenase accessory factor
MKNIYLQIPVNPLDVPDMVLATVTGTEGSTPQKPGSSALFNKTGLVAGTIGGGVLEGKVQKIAIESINRKEPVHYIFSLDLHVADGEDALCGGKINILVDTDLVRHKHVFESLRKSYRERIPGILVTLVTNIGDNKSIIDRYWVTDEDSSPVPAELKSQIEPELRALISGNGSYGLREIKTRQEEGKPSHLLLLEPVIPSARLIIAGAGHIGKALSKIGSMLDFEITIIDDRPEFANADNIPAANYIVVGDIGNSIKEIEKKNDTFIVIVTRGHRDDGNALKECIGSGAAYIGMIGSKTKIERMRQEFIGKGWATKTQWDEIYAPIGLDIKSGTVEEIAVSIAAQLVQVKNSK